jgi:hypothetical protein
MIAFGFEGSATVRAGRAPVEKRLHLVLQETFMDRGEELFGLPECQAQMLDALRVLLQGNDVSNGVFCPTPQICSAPHIRGVGQKPPR